MKGTKNEKNKKKKKIEIDLKHLYLIFIPSVIVAMTIVRGFDAVNFLAVLFVCLILMSIVLMDIFRYKPAYTKKNKMLILLMLLLIGTIVFGRGVEYLFLNFSKGMGFINHKAIIYGIPLEVGPMLICLLFDSHTAIIFSFIISMISGIWQGDAFYGFYVFTGSIVAVFSVLRCKKRTDLIKGGMYISGVNIISAIVVSLHERYLTQHILQPIIFAATSGISVAAFVSIILPVLEYTFKVNTDITLLELLDLNQPLMKSLMINAPGTYHHSVIVGNLVETAAEDVGVNPLLARVTAYYHDIGKIKMADYFIENQSNAVNKHEKLTPHMSSLILISHVKEGLELADEYNLPEPVKDIITQHHGRSIMMFFYQKAKEEQSEPPKEEDYRYPGPRPQSKVAALVMIADSIEAASRVLKDPTPSRVVGLVDKIVNNILIDGQLSECDLTLRDINIIKERYSYILNGIFHKRIEYPGFNFNKPQPSDGDRDKSNGKESAPKDRDRHTAVQA